jgi:threonine dehydratase
VNELTLQDVRDALARIQPHITRTPVLTSARLDELSGCRLFFKCENFQKTGAFKARGATNAVLSLTPEQAARGVATHSSGNHAAALARAAALRGIPAYVVMPRTASAFKVAAVERYGGEIIFCEPTHAAREAAASLIVRETGACLVHPFNDPRVIAGQATAALELLGEAPDLDVVFSPVGGGGLLSGTALVVSALRPGARVFGGEPEGAADTARSLELGTRTPVEKPASVADGLLAFVGDLTFPIIRELVSGVVTVSETEILRAMMLLIEVMKIAIEPSGAVGYAALSKRSADFKGLRVGVILSGGNMDLAGIPWASSRSAP